MAKVKTHAAKTLPFDRVIAMCWNTKAAAITEDESLVDCRKCLNAIAFYRECEAQHAIERARFAAANWKEARQ